MPSQSRLKKNSAIDRSSSMAGNIGAGSGKIGGKASQKIETGSSKQRDISHQYLSNDPNKGNHNLAQYKSQYLPTGHHAG